MEVEPENDSIEGDGGLLWSGLLVSSVFSKVTWVWEGWRLDSMSSTVSCVVVEFVGGETRREENAGPIESLVVWKGCGGIVLGDEGTFGGIVVGAVGTLAIDGTCAGKVEENDEYWVALKAGCIVDSAIVASGTGCVVRLVAGAWFCDGCLVV